MYKDRYCVACGRRIWFFQKWEWWPSSHCEARNNYFTFWVCGLECYEQFDSWFDSRTGDYIWPR